MTCATQFEEIRRASRYPKSRDVLKPHRVGRMVNDLHGAVLVDDLPQDHETADPHGVWLLGLADVARADYLVTGDERAGLLARMRMGNARILTARTFCQDVLQENDWWSAT